MFTFLSKNTNKKFINLVVTFFKKVEISLAVKDIMYVDTSSLFF